MYSIGGILALSALLLLVSAETGMYFSESFISCFIHIQTKTQVFFFWKFGANLSFEYTALNGGHNGPEIILILMFKNSDFD